MDYKIVCISERLGAFLEMKLGDCKNEITDEREAGLIQEAKNLAVASFDDSLPEDWAAILMEA